MTYSFFFFCFNNVKQHGAIIATTISHKHKRSCHFRVGSGARKLSYFSPLLVLFFSPPLRLCLSCLSIDTFQDHSFIAVVSIVIVSALYPQHAPR